MSTNAVKKTKSSDINLLTVVPDQFKDDNSPVADVIDINRKEIIDSNNKKFSTVVSLFKNKEFQLNLKKNLKIYFELFDYNENCKPKGEQMEFLIKKAFIKAEIDCVQTSSHHIGTDLIVKANNVSVKSGQHSSIDCDKKKTKSIKFSSYRTTSIQGTNFESVLYRKIRYCQDHLNKDVAILCVIPVFDHISKKYVMEFYLLNTSKIDLLDLKWMVEKTKKSKTNFFGESNSKKIEANFSSSMSDQLWMSIAEEYFENFSIDLS